MAARSCSPRTPWRDPWRSWKSASPSSPGSDEMTPLVLVHGGMNSSLAWAPVLPYLEAPAIAIDLPGRGKNPADLATVTLDDAVATVLKEADAAGFDRFVLVGHSLGGV